MLLLLCFSMFLCDAQILAAFSLRTGRRRREDPSSVSRTPGASGGGPVRQRAWQRRIAGCAFNPSSNII